MTGFSIKDMLAIDHVAVQELDQVLDRRPKNICTDTRSIAKGDVFLALRGERFNGHDFIDAALRDGAIMCIVDSAWYRKAGRTLDAPLMIVQNTQRAYGLLARAYRDRFSIPLVGITGSNGKTSTREMTAAVLGTSMNVLHTAGNFNNQIGVPATLLRLRGTHRAVVLEMGTNQPGDIAELCGIAGPTHGLITNIGRAHLEKLGSREGIAAEKSALFSALPAGGTAIVNMDEPLLRGKVRRGVQKLTYGSKGRCDIRIADIALGRTGRPMVEFEAPGYFKGTKSVTLRMPGRHAAWNAAAALATGMAFDVPADTALEAISRTGSYDRRMRIMRVCGVTLIDDTYNANPDSTLAALDTLQAMQARGARIAVLGDMLELGRTARQEHEAVGDELARFGVDFLFTFGQLSRATCRAAQNGVRLAAHFTDKSAICNAVLATIQEGDVVLVKGSRGMRMDEVMTFLQRRLTNPEA
jgi:UDP-N-acetylmuramoyl-tripeptide--D-alanyl-D-alanine ligase